MSIPLDRLYHYIESVAQNIRGGNVLIYRFVPHGSKKLEDLNLLNPLPDYPTLLLQPQIFCYDQEPLNYDYYKDSHTEIHYNWYKNILINSPSTDDDPVLLKEILKNNIRHYSMNIYDKCILIHSEKRSVNLEKYKNDQFIPVYYWNHALISQDWFRYAQHLPVKKSNSTTDFLIYNRAWSGTREYRLKFMELLINNDLISYCKTWCNAIEPELQIHYADYKFINSQWRPNLPIEQFLTPTVASSCSSADINYLDYATTNFEVVLETLFNDSRLHLTEKVLRPIASGQPFLLAATHGSLQYLREYGFKTFSPIIDESYDLIEDPHQRLESLVYSMKKIASWTVAEKEKNMQEIFKIAQHNREHFFSDKFFNFVVDELVANLTQGLAELEDCNTSKRYLNFRKLLAKNSELKTNMLLQERPDRTKNDLINALKTARTYYNRYLKTLNK
jgi:hypothetical protein